MKCFTSFLGLLTVSLIHTPSNLHGAAKTIEQAVSQAQATGKAIFAVAGSRG